MWSFAADTCLQNIFIALSVADENISWQAGHCMPAGECMRWEIYIYKLCKKKKKHFLNKQLMFQETGYLKDLPGRPELFTTHFCELKLVE